MTQVAGIAAIAGWVAAGAGCDLVFSPADHGDDAPVIDAQNDPDSDTPGADAMPDGLPDGPIGDRDGDGWLDGDDGCPDDPNPLQRDEDGDGRQDVCDACIGMFDNQTDTDLDGVGDFCDLFPTTGGTLLIGRAFVENGAQPSIWQATNAGWNVNEAEATQTVEGLPHNDLMWLGSLPNDGYLWVELRFVPGTLNGTDNAAGAWIDADVDLATPVNGHRCDIHRDSGGTLLELSERVAGSDQPLDAVPSLTLFPDPIYLQAMTNVDGFDCTQPGGGTANAADPPASGDRTIGLHTSHMEATFTHVLVYHQPP